MKDTFKVLLYTEFENAIKLSGLGKSVKHQEQALRENGIPFTRDPRDSFDIAHINFYGPKSYFLAKKCLKEGKKVIYHAHSTEEDFRNSFVFSNQISPLYKKWLIKCYQTSNLILTPTPYSKKLLESYGLKNVEYISNGIDTKFFVKDTELAKSFRQKYGFKDEDKVILGIGLFLERKGILDFIELAKSFPDYKFIWFGYTDPKIIPKKIRDAIKNKPANLQLPGHVPAVTIKSALSACDLYIFPTLEETEGIPIVEACSVGAKSLIRDIPVFDGWLEDGKNVYKAKNLDEFKEKLEKIIKGELPDLTKEAKKVAKERDIVVTGQKLIQFYRSVLN